MKVLAHVGFALPADCDPKEIVAGAKEAIKESQEPHARVLRKHKTKFRHAKNPNEAEVEMAFESEDVALGAVHTVTIPRLKVLLDALGVAPRDMKYVEVAQA